MKMSIVRSELQLQQLAQQIKSWGLELGFQAIAITDTQLDKHEAYLTTWLSKHYQGEMHYMQRHGTKRSRPDELLPGTLRIISARMNYLPTDTQPIKILRTAQKAYISRYALGQDYHKLMRKRLQQLGAKIKTHTQELGYRAFVDSAPVLEKALAEKAGLGWIGKNTLLLNREAGSWFFLGELFTDLPLPIDNPSLDNHCGRCSACITVCPTQAIVGPYQLDARRCISYLTIELRSAIPEELRPLIGNRIFGCDDCQLFCPWNRFAKPTDETGFKPRHGLADQHLIELFQWSESEFLTHTQGSAIRRIGYECWLRNIAVALGNAPTAEDIITALKTRVAHPSALVREHVAWALQRHGIA